jgi:hypothetical protein
MFPGFPFVSFVFSLCSLRSLRLNKPFFPSVSPWLITPTFAPFVAFVAFCKMYSRLPLCLRGQNPPGFYSSFSPKSVVKNPRLFFFCLKPRAQSLKPCLSVRLNTPCGAG